MELISEPAYTFVSVTILDIEFLGRSSAGFTLYAGDTVKFLKDRIVLTFKANGEVAEIERRNVLWTSRRKDRVRVQKGASRPTARVTEGGTSRPAAASLAPSPE